MLQLQKTRRGKTVAVLPEEAPELEDKIEDCKATLISENSTDVLKLPTYMELLPKVCGGRSGFGSGGSVLTGRDSVAICFYSCKTRTVDI